MPSVQPEMSRPSAVDPTLPWLASSPTPPQAPQLNLPPPMGAMGVPKAPPLNIPTAPPLSIPTAPPLSIPMAPSLVVPTAPQLKIPAAPPLSVPNAPALSKPAAPPLSIPGAPQLNLLSKGPALPVAKPDIPESVSEFQKGLQKALAGRKAVIDGEVKGSLSVASVRKDEAKALHLPTPAPLPVFVPSAKPAAPKPLPVVQAPPPQMALPPVAMPQGEVPYENLSMKEKRGLIAAVLAGKVPPPDTPSMNQSVSEPEVPSPPEPLPVARPEPIPVTKPGPIPVAKPGPIPVAKSEPPKPVPQTQPASLKPESPVKPALVQTRPAVPEVPKSVPAVQVPQKPAQPTPMSPQLPQAPVSPQLPQLSEEPPKPRPKASFENYGIGEEQPESSLFSTRPKQKEKSNFQGLFEEETKQPPKKKPPIKFDSLFKDDDLTTEVLLNSDLAKKKLGESQSFQASKVESVVPKADSQSFQTTKAEPPKSNPFLFDDPLSLPSLPAEKPTRAREPHGADRSYDFDESFAKQDSKKPGLFMESKPDPKKRSIFDSDDEDDFPEVPANKKRSLFEED